MRGAPAIAIVGCLSLAVELKSENHSDKQVLRQDIEGRLNYLVSSRPTAVNMKIAADELIAVANSMCEKATIDVDTMKKMFIERIEHMLQKDIGDNKAIGENGSKAILEQLHINDNTGIRVLTHCNTGSLATAGYGTALGVIRHLHSIGRLDHVYCTETRPYNQGARLTAYELVHDKIPCTLIVDSMVAAVMRCRGPIHAVVVGADRVAANGDTANKIGTYQIAVSAKHHRVPFYVCAPTTSVDLSIKSGDKIVIEERPQREMTHVGEHRIAAAGVQCWNPAFDVTPASLVTAIVTEVGVFEPGQLEEAIKNATSQTTAAATAT